MKPKVLYCQYATRGYGDAKTSMSGFNLVCDLTDYSVMLGVVVTRYAQDVIIVEQNYCYYKWQSDEQYVSGRQLIQDKYTRDFEAIRQGVELFDLLMDTFGYKLFPDLYPPAHTDDCSCLPDSDPCSSCKRKAKDKYGDEIPF